MCFGSWSRKDEWGKRKAFGLERNVDSDRTRSKDSNGRSYKTLVASHRTTTVTNLIHKEEELMTGCVKLCLSILFESV